MYLTISLFMLFGLGTVLLTHLGAGTAPKPLRTVASCLIKPNSSAAAINRILWVLFILVAGAFFTPILIGLYRSAVALGKMQ